jgi:hypothetical protein
MKTIKVYTPAELKKKNPVAFEKAHQRWNDNNTEIPWMGEIIDSLKAVFDASGINLRDYSIDAYGYSSVRFDMKSDVRELQGQRALAWLENNLLADLRYKDGIRHIKERVWKSEHVKSVSRADGVFIHKVGELKSCPFTGVCFDEDMLESLQKSIKAGDTLEDAYNELASVAAKAFSDEIEQSQSEEEFLAQDHLEYTIDGRLV